MTAKAKPADETVTVHLPRALVYDVSHEAARLKYDTETQLIEEAVRFYLDKVVRNMEAATA